MADPNGIFAAAKDLKPCPFCGSTDIRNISADHGGPTDIWRRSNRYFAINCKNCGASVPHRYSNAPVVADWNTRPNTPVPTKYAQGLEYSAKVAAMAMQKVLESMEIRSGEADMAYRACKDALRLLKAEGIVPP